jgi:hypothetical protein
MLLRLSTLHGNDGIAHIDTIHIHAIAICFKRKGGLSIRRAQGQHHGYKKKKISHN